MENQPVIITRRAKNVERIQSVVGAPTEEEPEWEHVYLGVIQVHRIVRLIIGTLLTALVSIKCFDLL